MTTRDPVLRAVFADAACRVVLIAAFPRLAYRLRWPTRVGPRGFVAYVAMHTVIGFFLRQWVAPYVRRKAVERAPPAP